MRAVKNNLSTPSGEVEESEGPRWTAAIGTTYVPPHDGALVFGYPQDFLLPKTKHELTLARNGFFSEMGGK